MNKPRLRLRKTRKPNGAPGGRALKQRYGKGYFRFLGKRGGRPTVEEALAKAKEIERARGERGGAGKAPRGPIYLLD